MMSGLRSCSAGRPLMKFDDQNRSCCRGRCWGASDTAPAVPLHTIADLGRQISSGAEVGVGCTPLGTTTGRVQQVLDRLAQAPLRSELEDARHMHTPPSVICQKLSEVA